MSWGMKSEFRRGPLTRITIWSGADGPLALSSGSVGIEYRGRLGHPSSYGLLAGRLRQGETISVFDVPAGAAGQVSPPVKGEDVVVGIVDAEYAAAVNSACVRRGIGLDITAVAAGEISSSRIVFSKLATLLCVVLSRRTLDLEDNELWQVWESA